MRVLALPRDPNPYQGLLYGEMRRLGVSVRYIGEPTRSRTLNLLLLPLEVLAGRIAGARVVHLHWVFAFTLPGESRFPVLRRLAYAWFRVWLRTCRMLRMRLVWTAHNVLPHQPVFADDVSARRALVDASDLVLAHSQTALAELAVLGAVPRRSAVIEHGPLAPAPSAGALRAPGTGDGPRQFLFFGKIEEYKGVEDLLAAFLALPADTPARLTVAGQCEDPRLRSRLHELARRGGGRIALRLEHVPAAEVTPLLSAADAVVLPFRRVTTSGSALLALSHGRPLLVPDLAGLADLPDQAVLRYNGGIPGLAGALARLAHADRGVLAAMSTAASEHQSETTWQEIAERTAIEMRMVLTGTRASDRDGQPGGTGTSGRDGPPGGAAGPAGGGSAVGRLWSRARAAVSSIFGNALYRGSAILLANTAATAILGVAFWTLAAHRYPAVSVGLFSGVTAAVSLLGTVAALGLPNVMIRHVAGIENPLELVALTVAAIATVGTLICLGAVIVLGPHLPPSLHVGQHGGMVVLVTILVVVTAVSSVIDAGLIAIRYSSLVLIKNLLGSLVKVGALLLLARFASAGLLIAFGLGLVLSTGVSVVALARRLGGRWAAAGSLRLLRRYLSLTSANYLATVMGILPLTVVPVEVLVIRGAAQTARFAVAFLIVGFLNLIPSTVAQVLFAEASRRGTSMRDQLVRAVRGVYALLLPAVIVVVVAAPLLLSLFGAAYASAATGCLRVLALGTLLTGGTYLVDSLLIARDRKGAYVFINGVNAFLVLGCVAILLPHGLTAAAAGWALAQGVSFLIGLAVLAASRDRRRRSRAELPHGDTGRDGRARPRRRAMVIAATAVIAAIVSATALGGCGSTPSHSVPVQAGDSKVRCIYTKLGEPLRQAERATGVTYNCLETFSDADPTWAAWARPWLTNKVYGYVSWLAAEPGRQLILTQNLIPDSLAGDPNWAAKCASGAYDSYATQLARNLVKAGFGYSVIRLGPEMNGTWNVGSLGSTPASWKQWGQCFAQEVRAMRAVPGSHLLFDWNVNAGYRNIPLADFYPGNAYVDIIGIDFYDTSGQPLPPVGHPDRWTALSRQPDSLMEVAAFAAANHKPLSFPEWATVGSQGDDAAYVTSMGAFIAHHDIAFQSWFDAGDNGILQLTPGMAPRSLRAYIKAFG
jgi:O-antigen/teichoic acid export membrane protein/glycosyltransferase involved in cell wall biosynthesis